MKKKVGAFFTPLHVDDFPLSYKVESREKVSASLRIARSRSARTKKAQSKTVVKRRKTK